VSTAKGRGKGTASGSAARERLLARLKPCPDAVKSVPPFEKRGDGAPGTKQRLDEKSVERKRGVFGSFYVTAKAVTHKAHSATVAGRAAANGSAPCAVLCSQCSRAGLRLCRAPTKKSGRTNRAYGACAYRDTSD